MRPNTGHLFDLAYPRPSYTDWLLVRDMVERNSLRRWRSLSGTLRLAFPSGNRTRSMNSSALEAADRVSTEVLPALRIGRVAAQCPGLPAN